MIYIWVTTFCCNSAELENWKVAPLKTLNKTSRAELKEKPRSLNYQFKWEKSLESWCRLEPGSFSTGQGQTAAARKKNLEKKKSVQPVKAINYFLLTEFLNSFFAQVNQSGKTWTGVWLEEPPTWLVCPPPSDSVQPGALSTQTA